MSTERIAETGKIRELCLSHADLPEVQEVMGVANTLREAARLLTRLEEAERVMQEIAKGEGGYSTDPLTHAGNTIDNMTDLARRFLEGK